MVLILHGATMKEEEERIMESSVLFAIR